MSPEPQRTAMSKYVSSSESLTEKKLNCIAQVLPLFTDNEIERKINVTIIMLSLVIFTPFCETISFRNDKIVEFIIFKLANFVLLQPRNLLANWRILGASTEPAVTTQVHQNADAKMYGKDRRVTVRLK